MVTSSHYYILLNSTPNCNIDGVKVPLYVLIELMARISGTRILAPQVGPKSSQSSGAAGIYFVARQSALRGLSGILQASRLSAIESGSLYSKGVTLSTVDSK